MAKLSEAYQIYQEGFLDRLRARVYGADAALRGIGRGIKRKLGDTEFDDNRPIDIKRGYRGAAGMALARNYSEKFQDVFDKWKRDTESQLGMDLDDYPGWNRVEKAFNQYVDTIDYMYSVYRNKDYKYSGSMSDADMRRQARSDARKARMK